MWVRSEFGRLCNLAQASEIAIANGTVEARFGKEVCPLAHRADEADALKIFDRIAQGVSEDKNLLDLSTHAHDEAPPSATIHAADTGDKEKAL